MERITDEEKAILVVLIAMAYAKLKDDDVMENEAKEYKDLLHKIAGENKVMYVKDRE